MRSKENASSKACVCIWKLSFGSNTSSVFSQKWPERLETHLPSPAQKPYFKTVSRGHDSLKNILFKNLRSSKRSRDEEHSPQDQPFC
jgi:hypothetical protein